METMEIENVSLTKEEYEALTNKAQTAETLSRKLSAAKRGIAFDAIDDVVMLAAARANEETDFEAAMDEIAKKYPGFGNVKPTTGIETKGSVPHLSGVEAAFLRKNPGLKIEQ
jgi:hypothetical protein